MIEIRPTGLTLLKILPNPGKDKNGKYRTTKGVYLCVCGNTKQISISEVKSGHVKSCGCYKRIQNGLSRHPLYFIWNGIYDRCYRTNHHAYQLYGERGVEMCEEWQNDFISFYNWCIENGWKKGMEVDKDVKAKAIGKEGKMYSPEWCSIVTRIENNNSKQFNVTIEYNGKKQTLAQWSRQLGIPKATLHHRIRDYGFTIEDAFSNKSFRRGPKPQREVLNTTQN